MIDRVLDRKTEWTTVLGSTLVLVGLALFIFVFVMLLPALTDPTGVYERWFPTEEDGASATTATVMPPAGPTARFAWEAVAVESVEPPVYRVRLTSTAAPAESDIVSWSWDLGDGTTGSGETLIHDYASYGAYLVSLTISDAAGDTDMVGGEIAVPGIDTTAGAIGQVVEGTAQDIEASLESAVGSVGAEINATIDGAFGSIGRTVRGAVVVLLFAFAALAITVVAWRVARIGVMVLTGGRQTSARRPGAPPGADDHRGERQLELV